MGFFHEINCECDTDVRTHGQIQGQQSDRWFEDALGDKYQRSIVFPRSDGKEISFLVMFCSPLKCGILLYISRYTT